MEITIQLDLPAIIAQAVTAERIQPLVDKAISETIKSAISDATGYNSPFRKAVTEQLAEAMPHGLRLDDVAKFQQVLNQALQSVVQGENAAAVRTALTKAVKEVAPDVPETISLSDFMKAVREGFHKDSGEPFYAFYETNEGHSGGGHLYLDSNPRPGYGYGDGGGKYSANYHLAFNSDGDVYSIKMDGKQITPNARPTVISRFDSIVMAMYVGRTRLHIDMDEDEVRYAAEACDD